MPIQFQCSSCGRQLRVPDNAAGRQAKCPACGAIGRVPAGGQAPGSPGAQQPVPQQPLPQQPVAQQPVPQESFEQPADFGFPSAAGPSATENPYAPPQATAYTPQPVGVTAGGIRNQVVDPGSVLSYAWRVWSTNLGLLVGVFVCATAINGAMGFFIGMAESALMANDLENEGLAVGVLGRLLANVVGLYLGIGQAQISLKLARCQPAQFVDLFGGGPRFFPVLGACILAGIALMIGFMLCVIPGVVLTLLFWPFYFIVVDDKAGVLESFTMARLITEGNVLTTFVLWLASVGIMIAGLLALCIGVIFAAPLVAMIWAVAYLMMSGQLSPAPASAVAPAY